MEVPAYVFVCLCVGMANPGPVASALWTDEQLEAGVQLDSIVTVVDAINIDRQLHAKRADDTVNEAQVQVGHTHIHTHARTYMVMFTDTEPAACCLVA